MSQAASITVAVRVRPPNSWEADRLPSPGYNDSSFMGDGHLTAAPRSIGGSLRPIVQVMDDKVLIFDPKDPDVSRAFEQKGFAPPGTKRYKDHRYTFDRVFDEDARQVDVYENTTRPLLDGLLDGFNATVFAYGATGCGKTHTISGTESDPGIIYLTMAELFQKIDDMKDDITCDVTLSFLEIYNEEIRDLLVEPGSYSPKGGLAMREDKSNRIIVAGLTERKPMSAAEVKEMVLLGNSRRTQSPTHANETSSRSHAVLQVNIAQSPRTASTTEERTMATLSIIDLAGSERASATKNMGERMVEGANINKSLLALGNCINALCESGGRTRHIPYRNSKLTRLLKFSLGGNCKTVMIVCVAPCSNHFEDTQNTLKYANRAKDIKTKVSRNFINVDRHVAQYVEAINRLNDEVAELKAKLAGKLSTENDSARRKRMEAKSEVERAKADIASKFQHTQASLMDGATCEANLFVSQTRLSVIRNRLHQLEVQGRETPLAADLLAEQGLLKSLASPDEAVTHPHSTIHQDLQKSGNANAMFEATLRAVSERRSDKLDDICIESVRTDVRYRRTEMDNLRAQTREAAYKDALSGQAAVITDLVGILARCTVMMSDGGRLLQSAIDEASEGGGDLHSTSCTVADSLVKVAESNDKTFEKLVGQATTSFALGKESSLREFSGHAAGTKIAKAIATSRSSKHRRSSITTNTSHSSPSRKLYKSPRKPTAFRQSLIKPGLPPPIEHSTVRKQSEKKSLRWKDEAGEGDLDDQVMGPNTRSVSVPSIPEMPVFGLSAPSKKGSESENEWEDEKTDDSLSMSFFSKKENEILGPMMSGGPSRKSRNSRLKPDYLKRSVSALGSLGEESEEEQPRLQRSSPLAERGNHLPPSMSLPNMSRSSKDTASEYDGMVPAPRIYPRGTPAKSSRRRSNIGPVRVEKTSRRRSSLIPRASPPDPSFVARNAALYGPPKRMLIADELPRKSPGKKKRNSLTGGRISVGYASLKIPSRPPLPKSLFTQSYSPDLTMSVDLSASAKGKPTWR